MAFDWISINGDGRQYRPPSIFHVFQSFIKVNNDPGELKTVPQETINRDLR